ncbi:DUF58 domain-containing protein [Defluviimonas aestuarii]|uniref:DUF58 domain-containing protein n=1 Tax=Albidovulum aestuarii TaxID=1130726 RepID=UPI00249ADA86|nr:DUF58 domain-containing protein [Defluviimonas aestuarii]MDI3336415.1 DUF58 domain-containing protein [Defluviimonas aestuarii]
MRPSRRLVALVLMLAALTVLIGLVRQDGGIAASILWGAAVLLALADLALSPSAKGFAVVADLAETGFVGKTAALSLDIASRRGALPRRFDLRLTHDPGISTGGAAIAVEPETGSRNVTLTVRLDLVERGEAALQRLSMRFGSRLGLFDILPRWPLSLKIDVIPDVAPVHNGEIQTRMLPLLDGLKDMNLRGEGSEFHQLRDFQQGMDPRNIDWKRSARLRGLVARETRAERNHQIVIGLDCGHLMGERIGKISKLDHAINAALALTWAGGLGGDNVGFFSFASRPQSFLPPRPGRRAFGQIQKHSAALRQESAETNHTLGLTQLNSHLDRRSLVVIFSDFVDSVTAELLVENLAVMTRHHLIHYVALQDPELEAFAHPDDVAMTAVANAISARQMLFERRHVLDRLRRLGVLCLDTTPDKLTAGLISRYIDIKSQELI